MKIFALVSKSSGFAEAAIIGTKNSNKSRCSLCRVPFDRYIPNYIQPIKIQFQPSSSTIGDFIFCVGTPYPIVTLKVKELFQKWELPCVFEDVEVVKPDKKKLVPEYPLGIPLFLLRAASKYPIDLEKSKLPQKKCEKCSRENIQWLNREKIYITADVSASIFAIEEFADGATYITERLYEILRQNGVSNIDHLLEVGEIENDK